MCPSDVQLADTDPCDDGNSCTDASECQSGVCEATSLLSCEVLMCFEDGPGSFTTTANVGVGDMTYGTGTGNQTDFSGNQDTQPAACPGETGSNNRAPSANGWDEVDMTDALNADDCYTFTVETGDEPLVLRFDNQASGTGPTLWGVEVQASIGDTPQVVVSDVATSSSFTSHPMETVDLEGLGLEGQSDMIVRLCGYGASGGAGTWRLDNVHVFTGGCTDGIQNQDETGVDCGGTTCPACP
jgi:hypothetical protein